MKILLVTDNLLVEHTVTGVQNEQRPQLSVTADASYACELLAADEFDLLIIDVDLAGDPVAQIFAACPARPFTLVIGSAHAKDRIATAVQAGASDFDLKPLDSQLIRLRIAMALAQSSGPVRAGVAFGPLSFNVATGGIELNGARLHLTPTENTILLALMRRGGSVVNKEFLSRNIAGDDEWIGKSAIEVHIHRLRRKLQGTGTAIETVRGLGYALQSEEGLAKPEAS